MSAFAGAFAAVFAILALSVVMGLLVACVYVALGAMVVAAIHLGMSAVDDLRWWFKLRAYQRDVDANAEAFRRTVDRFIADAEDQR